VSRASTWFNYNAAARRFTLALHVQPGARRSEIVGLHGGALKIKVAAPAVDNKANAALTEFLSETLGIPKSAVAISHGAAGRRKVVEITGGPELVARLGNLS
jgi:uncharacterized protein (TIGR00251 family)